MIAAEELSRFPDTFNGDDAQLVQCIEALLSLDAKNALVPHGLGGHARGLLSAAMHRLASQSRAAGVQGADLTQEAVAEAMKRWPDAQSAIMFMASAVGSLAPITANDIAWANTEIATPRPLSETMYRGPAHPEAHMERLKDRRFIAEPKDAGAANPAADAQGVEALLRSENPDRKDFTVDEALSIADKHEAAHRHVPSVSRTLAAEDRRLYVLAPHFRGFAHLGLGRYRLFHSRPGVDAELFIVPATPDETAGRVVGDLRDDGPDEIPAELMAVRLRFENAAGLDALEQQLRLLRETHFPAPLGGQDEA